MDVAEYPGSARPEAPKSPKLSVQLEVLLIFYIWKEGWLELEESPGSSSHLEVHAESPGSSRLEAPKSPQLSVQLEGLLVF